MHSCALRLAVAIGFAAAALALPARAQPAGFDCRAAPPASLPRETVIRDVEVKLIPNGAETDLVVAACIDSRRGVLEPTRIGLFSTDGHLLTVHGNGATTQGQGPVFRHRVESQYSTKGLRLDRMAEQVLVQMPFASPRATTSRMHTARFVGLAAAPFGTLAADACLGPVPRGEPAVRDLTTLMNPAGATIQVEACVAARRMMAADVTSAILVEHGTGAAARLSELGREGNNAPALSPLEGLAAHGGRTVALVSMTVQHVPAPMPADPFPLSVVKLGWRECVAAGGSRCTPGAERIAWRGVAVVSRGSLAP